MLAHAPLGLLLACATLLAAGACAPLERRGKSPLSAPQLPFDSAVLDVITLRVPLGDPRLADVWTELDEQALPAELRKRLAVNGFRAGLCGTQLPRVLEHWLYHDQPVAGPEATVAQLDPNPTVRMRRLQLRAGQPSEILASAVYDELPLLVSADGQLGGRPFQQAQCVFQCKLYPGGDGRSRVELLPQVQHGEPRQRYVATEGTIHLQTRRDAEVFVPLAIDCTLSPGDMLVLTSHTERAGSLGYQFFVDRAAASLEQKLLIIRLAQSQNDNRFEMLDRATDEDSSMNRLTTGKRSANGF